MTKKAADKIVKRMEDYYRVDDAVDEPVVFTQWDDAKNYSLTALLNDLKKNHNWRKNFYSDFIPAPSSPPHWKNLYAGTITGRSSHKANDDLRDAVAYGSRASDLRAMGLNDRDLSNSKCYVIDYVELEKRIAAYGNDLNLLLPPLKKSK